MNIVLLGPPGAGKGTQARLIQEQYDLALIVTGDIFREEIKKETPLGLQIKETIEAGRFPSDEVVLDVFEAHLRTVKDKGVVLDGVPRTLNQAKKIEDLFAQLGLSLDVVVQLSVDNEEIVRRLSSRFMCSTCGASYTSEISPRVEGVCDKCSGREFIRRPDDEPEAIRTRLHIYNEQTKPLTDYYAQTHRLRVADGMKSVKEVNAQIRSLLEELQVLTSKSRCLYSAQDVKRV